MEVVDLVATLMAGGDFDKIVEAGVIEAVAISQTRKQYPPNVYACHPELLAAIAGDGVTPKSAEFSGNMSALDWLLAACRNGPDAGIHHAALFRGKSD